MQRVSSIIVVLFSLLTSAVAYAIELVPPRVDIVAPATQPASNLLTKSPDHVSFRLDVMPIFMRAGCNTGSCHGAARGQDGFHLSLFGYDPEGDYFRLTRELANRRINLALPSESLLLTKSIGAVQHTGGERFKSDSPDYHTLKKWIEEGANLDPDGGPEPASLDIQPKQIVLEGSGATQQFSAVVRYSDGTTRDVTNLAVFMTNNDNAATISENGLVTAKNRGEAFVMARFATFTVGSQVIVIPKDLQYEWPATPENNYIDALINAKLQKLRILPSELCDDETYLRRVFLDVIGQLPGVEERAAFVTDTDPLKREKIVDSLLGRKEFVELWVMKFAELLKIRSIQNQVSPKAVLLYFNWLQDRIAGNVPINQIVKELLGATGGTFKNPATNYYQVELDKLKLAEDTAQVFLGMRMQCAQCHNHPFDRWTMNDYYGFVSFFSQVGRKSGEDPRETIIFNAGGGETPNPLTRKPVPPTFLGGDIADTKGKDRRQVLADWIASSENPYFARNLANMIWSQFFGRGIIEPVDDVRISNPPSNPELLDALSERFTQYNFDFRKLVRDICTSRTYQLSSRTNESNAGDQSNFSHASVRRIRAEVLLDVITQVTETKEKFKGLPLGARAVQIADGETNNYFLRTFGRATRETVCSCEVKMEPNLSQALHLLNGKTVSGKLQQSKQIEKMLDKGKMTEAQIVEELYLRCLARKPTEKESSAILAMINAEGADKRAVLNDLFWALLNSQEFIFNH